jgi:hypothetical protein
MADTGSPDGTCAPVVDGVDECNGPEVCVGGMCSLKPNGFLCSNDNQCVNTCSAEGICCTAECDGACESCAAANTGMDDGTCAAVTAGTDPLMSCGADQTCDGMGACKTVDGATCNSNNPSTCLSGFCADGVCCDTVCDQLCEGCTMALNGTADGTCTPIPSGQDPEDECTDPATCDGAGMCQ